MLNGIAGIATEDIKKGGHGQISTSNYKQCPNCFKNYNNYENISFIAGHGMCVDCYELENTPNMPNSMKGNNKNFLKSPFESIRNLEKYTDKAVLDKCQDCGNGKLSTIRENRRGTGLPDRVGLYCDKCRVLWFNSK